MKLFTVINESTMERLEGFAPSSTHFLDDVEEFLYIHWELTPCQGRVSWAFPFLRGEKVRFTFHGAETCAVWLDPQGIVRVKDI